MLDLTRSSLLCLCQPLMSSQGELIITDAEPRNYFPISPSPLIFIYLFIFGSSVRSSQNGLAVGSSLKNLQQSRLNRWSHFLWSCLIWSLFPERICHVWGMIPSAFSQKVLFFYGFFLGNCLGNLGNCEFLRINFITYLSRETFLKVPD